MVQLATVKRLATHQRYKIAEVLSEGDDELMMIIEDVKKRVKGL